MQLLEQVRATIRRHDLIRPGMRVLVALSGGPDSVALTHLFRVLHDSGELVFAGLGHLNHGLRDGAGEDAAFCASLARSVGVPFESGAEDVAALAASHGQSIETAAHDARYAFLTAASTRLGADRIALGHSLDDQAETVLLRLIRGAGSRGLAGMHPRHGRFIRPLLETRRDALRGFLAERGLPFREDPSNLDRTIPRNRIRSELLPLLAREFNPRIVHALGQQAELAREEWDWIDTNAGQLFRSAVTGHSPEWQLELEPLQQAHPAVTRAAVRQLMEQAAGRRAITLQHVTAALALCGVGASGAADFPGQRWERRGRHVVLRSGLPRQRGQSEVVDSRADFSYDLPVPGEVRIPEASATISVEVCPDGTDGLTVSGGVAVRMGQWSGASWRVRNRRPGDRVALAGLRGRKKLQDLFVDEKVPRAQRDRIPIVVDERDRIVWVVGHQVAGEFRVTDPAQAMLVLRIKLWGGSA